MKLPIYMDNHATTAVDPRVFEAMRPYFTEIFGNAASRNHSFGWLAEEAVEKARKQVADLIGATAKEIVFTSGATESNNLALKGVAQMYAEKGNHIITAATEHKAVLDTCKRLEKEGARVTYLSVEQNGLVDLDKFRDAITDKTILVSIMYANNEIGVVQNLRRAGAQRRDTGCRQNPGGCDQGQYRSGVHQRAQNVRAEGRWRVVCAAPQSARATDGADGRRRP
jgi:cysteine desulfurase